MFEHGSAPLLRYRDSRLTTLAGAGGTRRKLRPISGGCKMNSGDHINYGKRLLTEIVGLQVFLTNVLSPCHGASGWTPNNTRKSCGR
jgi:hypothetical protein